MSKHGKTSLRRTLVAGSEEDFDVICDPCNSDGQRVQATGHCIDCNVNMCISCMKFHKKLPTVKNHVIKDKSTLSQSQKARTDTSRPAEDKDPMTDRCPKHPDELIKFYCNSHRTLGCSDCVSLNHRSCKDILYIKEVSDGVVNSDELTKIQADLHMLIARLTSTQSRTKWIKQTMNESYSQTVADIKQLKKEIIDMLNQFETEIIEKASLMNKEKLEALDNAVSGCEREIRNTKALLADIERKKSMNRNNQLFISMKNAQSQIPDLADEADQLCNKSEYGRLSFQPDKQLNNLLSTLTSLGEMILVSQTKEVKAEYQHDINVKCDSDTENCNLSGIIVLPDGRLALADANNMSVKLVDVTKRKVAEQIQIDTNPLDLTCIPGEMIALTLDKERYIQVLSVSQALSASHTIAVSDFYLGIEYIPDKLVLICRPPVSTVHICDMSGVVLQKIETDFSANKLFVIPSRIAISPDNGVIYVSDFQDHAVVCLAIDGQLISTCKYASDSIRKPIGIAVDDGGYVYVCGEDSNTVLQLSPSGQLVKVLLGKKDGINVPLCIACNAGNLYIISSDSAEPTDRDNIKIFRLQN